jgi:hypothetical protein
LDIVTAFEQVGTYRGAAALCGTTHRTVKRVIDANNAGDVAEPRRPRALVHNTDVVRDVIAEKVRATDGRISAKRLLPMARAAGYTGSARNFRRAVADGAVVAAAAAGVPTVTAVAGRASRDRLDDRGRLAGVLRGVGVVALAVRARRSRPEGRDDDATAGRMLRSARRCPQGRAR